MNKLKGIYYDSKADRLSNVKEYYFSKKLREVAALLKEEGNYKHGYWESRPSAPDAVIKTLNETANTNGAHQYQATKVFLNLEKPLLIFIQNIIVYRSIQTRKFYP